ncbi:2TM domain-containing protein [Winogradskyella sp. UBA3174]|uniref:2TM domain-containing protein n=1 Tax=Winogradskyella sp. UBA3174 TaxID=1947785 RepID=UPI0025D9C966|nr:2TM domain-containing protein [Winogradskyella sp. UBA3174]|tara:strand:- start:79625 stop:79939 length:315 start_codon:yes stop_codon:yes gene_type:complete
MKTEASDLKYIKAKNRVEKLKKFYNHLAIYIIVNIIITGFKVSNNLDSWANFINELLSIDVLSVWTIWGLVLLIHFISLVFGQGWEERKIEELMNKELSNNHKD